MAAKRPRSFEGISTLKRTFIKKNTNLRVPICERRHSCRQAGSLSPGQVKAITEEFHQGNGFGGS
jgi:hypothetical protein